jgi:hypothetical protein
MEHKKSSPQNFQSTATIVHPAQHSPGTTNRTKKSSPQNFQSTATVVHPAQHSPGTNHATQKKSPQNFQSTLTYPGSPGTTLARHNLRNEKKFPSKFPVNCYRSSPGTTLAQHNQRNEKKVPLKISSQLLPEFTRHNTRPVQPTEHKKSSPQNFQSTATVVHPAQHSPGTTNRKKKSSTQTFPVNCYHSSTGTTLPRHKPCNTKKIPSKLPVNS